MHHPIVRRLPFRSNFASIIVAIFSFTLFTATSTDARATAILLDSIEWLTCSSDIVVVGKLISVATDKSRFPLVYEDCVLNVSEVIRGRPAKEIKFCYMHIAGAGDAKLEWLSSRGDILLFLSVHKPETMSGEHRCDGLLVPTNGRGSQSVITLSKPERHLFDVNCRHLSNATAILNTTRSAAAAYESRLSSDPKFQMKPRNIAAARNSEAAKLVSEYISLNLVVPAFLLPDARQQ